MANPLKSSIEAVMCACAQRRIAIVEAVKAISAGDRLKAMAQARFVAASAKADLGAALTAARARLSR
jgi:hypothetical protein